MAPKTFFTQLIIVSGIVALIIGLLGSSEMLAVHQAFSWSNWALLIIFCIALYYASAASAKNKNKNLFGQVFLVSIFFKMLLCLLLMIAYILIGKPDDKFFVLPFAIIYLFFTSFEVYFVTKLAKS